MMVRSAPQARPFGAPGVRVLWALRGIWDVTLRVYVDGAWSTWDTRTEAETPAQAVHQAATEWHLEHEDEGHAPYAIRAVCGQLR